ncbi:MAG: hypothetical protein ACP5KG_11185 [Myxococcota bacterium]
MDRYSSIFGQILEISKHEFYEANLPFQNPYFTRIKFVSLDYSGQQWTFMENYE